MRLHGVAAMRDFKRSLRPDATNPVIIVVPDRLAADRLKDPRAFPRRPLENCTATVAHK